MIGSQVHLQESPDFLNARAGLKAWGKGFRGVRACGLRFGVWGCTVQGAFGVWNTVGSGSKRVVYWGWQTCSAGLDSRGASVHWAEYLAN